MKRHFYPPHNQGPLQGFQDAALSSDERRTGIPSELAVQLADLIGFTGLNSTAVAPGDFDYNRPVDQMPVVPLGSEVTTHLL